MLGNISLSIGRLFGLILTSCHKEMNLCSTFSLDGIHVHLKPPFEITPLKILLAWYRKLLFVMTCNDWFYHMWPVEEP